MWTSGRFAAVAGGATGLTWTAPANHTPSTAFVHLRKPPLPSGHGCHTFLQDDCPDIHAAGGVRSSCRRNSTEIPDRSRAISSTALITVSPGCAISRRDPAVTVVPYSGE